jgi:hypothetical protein
MSGGSRLAYAGIRDIISPLRGRTGRWVYALVAICALLLASVLTPPKARAADVPPVGALAGSVTFDTECPSGIGVGVAFDGQDLWFSCYASSPDLFRADPRTGQVVAAYNISSGLGAIAYDATTRTLWAGWGGNSEHLGDVFAVRLDADFRVTEALPEFNTCPEQCFIDIDDGLAYDGAANALFLSPDTAKTITHYRTDGTIINDGPSGNGQFPYAGTDCFNSGLAIGDQLLFEGADGCSHIFVVNKSDPATVLFDFPTIVASDPNFRDEGLACDPNTFASQGVQVIWSKEAYPPNRAHAFVIPSGTCGVGGLPAPGGGPPVFSGPLPLLIAHGITGSAAGERAIELLALRTVPGLNQPDRTLKVNTGAITSVWDNATEINNDARDTINRTGAPAVNVISHSKGGLDTRVAMWEEPWLYEQLGMLATPNGGSAAADKLCWIRHHVPFGDRIQSQFGKCDNDSNGLYDLQTSYVQNTLNQFVRDDPTKTYFALASNCSTGTTTFKCNFAANAILNCRNGGDTAVCVESVYWLTTDYPGVPGGLEIQVPQLDGYTHSQMNGHPCPVLLMLAQLYPFDSEGNPWIDGDGSGCQNFIASAGTRPATPARRPAPVPAAMVDQAVIGGDAAPGNPFVATVDPEGGNSADATIYLSDGVTPTITVTDLAGKVDPTAVVQIDPNPAPGAGNATVALTGLSGTARQIHIALDQPGHVAVTTRVASTTTFTASASLVTGNTVRVTATLAGLNPGQSRKVDVQASYTDASGAQRSTPLVYDVHTRSYSAEITVPAGSLAPIDLTAHGPRLSRFTNTGILLPDRTGQIGQVHGDTLIAASGSGNPDTLRIPVAVTVATPGVYQLSLDLAAGGQTVASGGGRASLPAGPGVINVDVPLARLLASGAPAGSFQLVNGSLGRIGSGSSLIAQAATMGVTQSYNLDAYRPSKPVLSRLGATGIDTNNDGLNDLLRVHGLVSVAAAGQYQVSAVLDGPDGKVLSHVSRIVPLVAGRQPVSIDFDGHLIGSTGTGTYHVTGFTVTSAADPGQRVTAAALYLPLDANQWVGTTPNAQTLRNLWEQAHRATAIHRYGLFVSEHNRLDRIVEAATRGDTGTEKRELATFTDHVANAGTAIDAEWQQRILNYAHALMTTLGP